MGFTESGRKHDVRSRTVAALLAQPVPGKNTESGRLACKANGSGVAENIGTVHRPYKFVEKWRDYYSFECHVVVSTGATAAAVVVGYWPAAGSVVFRYRTAAALYTRAYVGGDRGN